MVADADTWDPDIYGPDGDEPDQEPQSAAPASHPGVRARQDVPTPRQRLRPGSQESHPHESVAQEVPVQDVPGAEEQVAGQQPQNMQAPPQHHVAQPGFNGNFYPPYQGSIHSPMNTPAGGVMREPLNQPHNQPGQQFHNAPPQQLRNPSDQQLRNSADQHLQSPPNQQRGGRIFEHYRDVGLLPWWAWSGVGSVVILCGLLALAGLSPSQLDPDTSGGFDPRFNEDYADMEVLGSGATFEGTVDNVPWELDITDVNWSANDQVSVQTSMPAPSPGMKYVGVDLDVSSDFRGTTPASEAFLFYYLTPGGQEYPEHYCSYGCLGEDDTVDWQYDGWIYFEVPETVPAGGYLRVNLLYSGEVDTLMELP